MLTGKTVLLVDDDRDDLELLQEALNIIDGDHKVIEAHDGIQGLSSLRDLKEKGDLPCLIVLDLNMPRMDGKSTFKAIKSDQSLSEIPVVIFSTSTSALDRKFFEHYNTAYFVKPVKINELSMTAAHMIRLCKHKTGGPWGMGE